MKLRETPPAAAALEGMSRQGRPPLREAAIKGAPSARGYLLELPLAADEQVFGLGLQMKSLNHRGLKKTLRVNSDPVADTGDSHAPVPFYVTTRGCGVFVDTARYATFYCGAHRRVRAKAAKPRGQAMMVEVPAAKGVDVYLFAGPTVREAVQRYVLFSGGGVLPPMWGLGIWYRTSATADETVVRAQAAYFRENDMPCDVYGWEPTWQTHAYSCTYTWDAARFPDRDGILRDLAAAHYRVNLWEHAFTHPDAPFYARLRKYAGDHEVWDGLVPDFTFPEARRVFAGWHARELVDRGVTGFKLDECDNSDFIAKPWSFPEQAQFPSGLDGEQMHSLFGVLYQRTMEAPFRERNRRTLGQVRSSGALAAPLPYVLYSDLYDHRDYLRALVNAGFSGLLWSPELRQAQSVEDLLRRVQSVIFSPHALVNAFQVKNPPWMQWDMDRNNRDDLLPDWRDAEREVRRWFQLRMSLLPYLYAAMARYREEGVPPVRALAMDWPQEPPTWSADDQWMFGDSILVAPVTWPARRRAAYLPGGAWYDFWSGARVEGGRSMEVDAPPDRIPLWVRDGSILPLARPVSHVEPGTVFDITARVYGEAPAPFTLFEDDGESWDFERGRARRLVLSWENGRGTVRRDGDGYEVERYRVTGWTRGWEKA